MQVRALSEERAGRRRPLRRESLLDLVGNTPLVRLNYVTSGLSPAVEIWVKLETMNPGGSAMDRPVRQILLDAVERGDLQNGRRVLDAVRGNAAVAYAMLGAALDIPVTLVLTTELKGTSRRMIDVFGAEILGEEPVGVDAARAIARDTAKQRPDEFWYANSYANASNPRAHEVSTATEIWAQTEGRVSHFVSTVGTAGTLLGTGAGLKGKNPGIITVACHLGEGAEVDDSVDEVVICTFEDARKMGTRLCREEGLPAGSSSGANVWAALEVAQGLDAGIVVTAICDHSDRDAD